MVEAGSTALRRGGATVRRDDGHRSTLVRDGVLVNHEADTDLLVFNRDHEFRSISNATGVIMDGNASGPEQWLNATTGKSLKDDLAERPSPPPKATRSEELWTDDELKAALTAYAEVLRLEAEGSNFSPTKLHRSLVQTSLARRTEGSVARRMSNISSALKKEGRPYSVRYKPSFEHVGNGIRARMIRFWDELEDLKPTADLVELAQRTTRARRSVSSKPPGQQSPTATSTQVTTYVRDPRVQAWVLNIAAGVCEGGRLPAPFRRHDGEPYLEVHHVRHLAEGGPDTVENTVAICPNCHRRLHYADDRTEFRNELYRIVPRLIGS